MAYEYLTASILAMAQKGTDPKSDYLELTQETIKDQFYNSSNWWTIQEEESFGSETYQNVDVRIAHVINAETGLKLGDDWKTLYFQDIDYGTELGKRYVFDGSIWLTVNTEVLKNLTATCTVRRCNNTLRWIDEPTGAYYEEPCCIEYLTKEPRNYATAGSPFMTPGGFLHIDMQFNEKSNLIKENQRFLFGNSGHWTCYKVIGTGINDFRNNITTNNDSAKLLVLDLTADFINEDLDDVVNGIADVNTNLYTLSLNKNNIEGSAGDTIQLYTTITYNEDTVERPVTWETDDVEVATVSSNGLVTFVANGTCTIKATITDNPVYDECGVIANRYSKYKLLYKSRPKQELYIRR